MPGRILSETGVIPPKVTQETMMACRVTLVQDSKIGKDCRDSVIVGLLLRIIDHLELTVVS